MTLGIRSLLLFCGQTFVFILRNKKKSSYKNCVPLNYYNSVLLVS